jgi:hypothetical protein
VRSILLIAALGAGCYQPSPPEGAPCSPDRSCPSGLKCDDGICVSHPRDAGGDGSLDPDALDAYVFDAPCGACSGDRTSFVPCAGPVVLCPLGCISTSGDHCAQLAPANGVDPGLTAMTNATSVSGGIATFDTSTGTITGAITRASGTGVKSGIGYFQVTSGGVAMGVFTFASLVITSSGEADFVGSRPAVFLSDGAISVAGRIDLSAGCYGSDRTCAGPGGGAGSTMSTAASGTGAGANGVSGTNNDDSGGGGGGGGEPGAAGGSAASAAGGVAGSSCIATTMIPLRGGGGGGAGGTGQSAFPNGGGGGGAIQLTSETSISITGVIVSGGAGGSGGNTMGGSSASAGSGGGGGGGVLLEAPSVMVTGGAVVAANGGGGGGGGNSGVGPGTAGMPGGANATPATGGAGTASPGPGNGGNGGAGGSVPTVGGTGTNSGGGGGGRGVIHVRATSPTLTATFSPTATTGPIATQ